MLILSTFSLFPCIASVLRFNVAQTRNAPFWNLFFVNIAEYARVPAVEMRLSNSYCIFKYKMAYIVSSFVNIADVQTPQIYLLTFILRKLQKISPKHSFVVLPGKLTQIYHVFLISLITNVSKDLKDRAGIIESFSSILFSFPTFWTLKDIFVSYDMVLTIWQFLIGWLFRSWYSFKECKRRFRTQVEICRVLSVLEAREFSWLSKELSTYPGDLLTKIFLRWLLGFQSKLWDFFLHFLSWAFELFQCLSLVIW